MNTRTLTGLLISLTALLLLSCSPAKNNTQYVTISDNQFMINGQPYYYVGTNFWFGAILGSTGEGGDRDRLLRELDFMNSNGIDNLRILIGADGENGVATKVEPTLQTAPGVYNDTIFDGLDFLLAEMGKRNMKAVLYFTNSWEWSGGYGQYLNWAGKGKNPIPAIDGWPAYMEYVQQYASCEECHEMLKNHITKVITRTNSYTGKKYADDPTIFSWQIGNEPRAFSAENKEAFAKWIAEMASHIKSLDANHLVSLGSEGKHGCEQDIALWEQLHTDPNIDYLTFHIWPKNWSWIDIEDMQGTLQNAIDSTKAYMNLHLEVARRLKKPAVLEEFGFPRDTHLYTPDQPTTLRDAYYESVFEQILQAANQKDVMAGCNFWSWAGYGRPSHEFWQKGDDYLGDPAQEEQGLNAVYDTDSTVGLIKKYNSLLRNRPVLADIRALPQTVALFERMKSLMEKGIMFGHQDDPAYGHGWYGEKDRSDVKDITGEYPAVSGWEIGHIEIAADYNLDSIYFTDMKRMIREVHERGAINTISWHGDNIATGNTAWDCEQDTVVSSILPGGIHHAAFIAYLDKVADFFLDLKDSKGELIPVIFRMYHEHTGGWFWWGNKQCTPEEYNELYRMTVRHLRDKRNVHNILYGFSPASIHTTEEFLSRYPGDEWVDIVGFDTYFYNPGAADSKDKYTTDIRAGLKVVTEYASKKGKIPVLAETGLEGVVIDTFFTEILYPAMKDFTFSYVLLWRNAYTMAHHHYVPYPGHPAADDFKKFTEKDDILMASDVKNEGQPF
jgi:mannan endo-1,4-beta-mannosidase